MKFFAVTTTSVYSVTDERDDQGYPIVQKIAIKKGKNSKIPIGGRLKNGRLVGIQADGIVLYDEDHPRPGRRQDPEGVNTAFWGGHTSPVVALFLKEDEARTCLNSKDLEKCDPRWEIQTKKVLSLIKDDHPVLVVSHHNPITFETS